MNSKYKFAPDPQTGFLSDEATKKYFSRLGFAVCALIFSRVFVASAFYNVCLVFFNSIPYLLEKISALLPSLLPAGAIPYWTAVLTSSNAKEIAESIVVLISIFAVGLPVFSAISKPLPNITPVKNKMGFKGWLGGLCIAVLFLYFGNSISSYLVYAIESLLNITLVNPVGESVDNSNMLTTIIFTVIIIPIFEEILFRKIICDKLLPLGEGYAVLVSAVIFGLIHGNFYQFPYAFLLGALFAFIYVKTGNLIYSIFYHMIINFIGAVASTWIFNLMNSIDMGLLEQIVQSQTLDMNDPATMYIVKISYIVIAYSALLMVIYISGLVLLFKARKKNLVRLDAGLLPPPKKHRFGNIFLTSGVAATIAMFVLTFILSLM